MNSTKPITVLLADDHMIVREGLKKLLEAESDIEVIGEAANEFAETLSREAGYEICETLDVAVRRAREVAVSDPVKGGVVLLSPACASWDQFKSFEHRGDRFRELVEALDGERSAA